MHKVEISELDKYDNDKILQKHANEYKNYCTIRRDLRKVNEICKQTIVIHDEIKNNSSSLEKHKNFLPFLQASVFHAINLYARWFKSTTKKPTLDKINFFNNDDSLDETHLKIINIRDKYIAHNELDLLGKDKVLVVFNNDEIYTESTYEEQLWLQDIELNMKNFQQCVRIVHNKIDADYIPKIQNKLNKHLKKIYKTS